MKIKKMFGLIIIFFLVLMFSGMQEISFAEEASLGQKFIDALESKNESEMKAIIKNNKDDVPEEIKAMVGYAMSGEAAPDERDSLLNITGMMATIYNEEFKDDRLLKFVIANINSLEKKTEKKVEKKAEKKASLVPTDKIKEELVNLGKGEWIVRNIKVDDINDIKIEIGFNEKGGAASAKNVSFADGKKAKEIVLKYIPNAKGRIDWISGGMGMKAVLLE